MILIGQYDSPFVRRVAIALHIYGLHYEHWPWSAFADADKIAAYNPLRRVPVLLLRQCEPLIESATILGYLDDMVGRSQALLARDGAQRRAELRLCALATGLCDKLVALIYERVLHETISAAWTARCQTQISAVLDALEVDREKRVSSYWFGEQITHGDIAVACALRFLREAHGAQFNLSHWPSLGEHADRCEALEAFQVAVQPFTPPQN